jgi:hypothetical protein
LKIVGFLMTGFSTLILFLYVILWFLEDYLRDSLPLWPICISALSIICGLLLISRVRRKTYPYA